MGQPASEIPTDGQLIVASRGLNEMDMGVRLTSHIKLGLIENFAQMDDMIDWSTQDSNPDLLHTRQIFYWDWPHKNQCKVGLLYTNLAHALYK